MVGLVMELDKQQLIEIVDARTAVRYKVVAETIDLDALKAEREELSYILNMKEPSIEELIEFGKVTHPYYVDREWKALRIAEIDAILEKQHACDIDQQVEQIQR